MTSTFCRIIYASLVVAGFLLLAGLVLHSNPFGNVVDVVVDESYFVEAGLHALGRKAPLTAVRSENAPYYGAITTDVSELVIRAHLKGRSEEIGIRDGVVNWAFRHFAEMANLVRIANGIVLLVLFAALAVLCLPKRESEVRRLALLFGLLLSNSLFLTLAPTGKVWATALAFEIVVAFVFFRQESALSQGEAAMENRTYIPILLWGSVFAFLQIPSSAIAFLWIIYAILLGHFTIRTFLKHLAWNLPLIIALAYFHKGVIGNFFGRMLADGQRTEAATTHFVTGSGAFDVVRQVVWPLETAFAAAPVVVVALAFVFIVDLKKKRLSWERPHRLRVLMYAHVVLMLIVYHLIFALGTSTRYLLPLTVAMTLAVVALHGASRRKYAVVLALAWAVALPMTAHAINLWNSPSSEKLVEEFFRSDAVSVDARTFIESPRLRGAIKLAIFEKIMGTSESSPTHRWEDWSILEGCEDACMPGEPSCIAFMGSSCAHIHDEPHNGGTIMGLMTAERLGFRYFVRGPNEGTPQ